VTPPVRQYPLEACQAEIYRINALVEKYYGIKTYLLPAVFRIRIRIQKGEISPEKEEKLSL
jgi:hypothetical protein